MATIEPRIVLRTSAAPYLLFGGIAGSVFILAMFVTVMKEAAFWLPTAVSGIILVTFLSWMATTTLTLAGNSIHYRSLFVRKDFDLANIIEARFVAGFSSFKPFRRLVITVRGQRGKSGITINMGLFDPKDSRKWLETLNSRLP
jgi:hypothetical protein